MRLVDDDLVEADSRVHPAHVGRLVSGSRRQERRFERDGGRNNNACMHHTGRAGRGFTLKLKPTLWPSFCVTVSKIKKVVLCARPEATQIETEILQSGQGIKLNSVS